MESSFKLAFQEAILRHTYSIQFYDTLIFLTNMYSLAFNSNSNVLYIYKVIVWFFINILFKLHNLTKSEIYAFQFLNLIL